MVVNGWVIGSVVLVAMIIGTAILRQRTMPVPQTTAQLAREVELLQQEVKELRSQTSQQKATIDTLQSLLVNRQAEIDRLNARVWQLEHPPAATPAMASPTSDGPALRPVLLAAIGTKKMLTEDLAALRRVQAQTGLRLTRLLPVSRSSLERTLERHRRQGTPVRYLHLAVDAGPAGLVFDDGLADGVWLSEQLAGVEVTVIAGCQSDEVADLLGVVPFVVSMREEVENRDAAIFAEAFWMAIGQGLDAATAFEQALRRAPAAVGEFVELHG